MSDRNNIDSGRRLLLAGAGVSAGLLMSNGGLPAWLTAESSVASLSYAKTLDLLDVSLSDLQRAHTVLPWQHPTRQITNTVAIHRSPHIGTLFNANQIALIRHLYNLSLSKQGVDWFRNTTAFEGKFEGSVFKIYTDATAGQLAKSRSLQTMINGGHYMLRDQLNSNQAYAFGGPISYGQQLGNGRYKVQGNAFKAHGDAVHDFHQSLNSAEQQQAYQVSPPIELVTQIQGANGSFSGLTLSNISQHSKELAKEMLATIFSGYGEAHQSEAFSAIEQNGGLESLHISLYSDYSFYADGRKHSALNKQEQNIAGTPYTQVWRIEGPACVIHFKGYPHVHAYINVVKDPAKIAIGETLAKLDSVVQGESIRNLLVRAMKQQTGEQFGFYHNEYLGRLSPGLVSSGSIYALDPYDNKVVVLTMPADQMTAELKRSLLSQGADLSKGRQVRFATIDYLARQKNQLSQTSDELTSFEPSGLSLRASVINYLRSGGQV